MRENFSVKGNINQWLKISIEALKQTGALKITQDPKYARLMGDFPNGAYLLLNMRRKENNRLLLEFDASDQQVIDDFKSCAARIFKERLQAEQLMRDRRIVQDSEKRAKSLERAVSAPSALQSSERQPTRTLSPTRNPVSSVSDDTRDITHTRSAVAVKDKALLSNARASKPVTTAPSTSVAAPTTAASPQRLPGAPARSGMKRRSDLSDEFIGKREMADEKSFTQMYQPDENDFIEQTQYLDTSNTKSKGFLDPSGDKTGILIEKFNKYCNQMWLIWLFLILCPPIGLFLLWYFKRMKIVNRIITSIVIFLYMIIIWFSFLGFDTGFNKQLIQAWYNDARAQVTRFFNSSTGGSTVKPTDRNSTDEASAGTFRYAYNGQNFTIKL